MEKILIKKLCVVLLVAGVAACSESPELKADEVKSSEITTPQTQINEEIGNKSFQNAVNYATKASASTQLAKTIQDWDIVSREWENAINAMKSIPESHPNYEIAQKKAVEYQNNFSYAKQVADKQRQEIISKAEIILNNIDSQYNFNRFIETWGMGTNGLYIPIEAWSNLSEEQKTTMIEYAKVKNLVAIVTGRLKGINNMYIDSTVWEK